MHLHGECDSSFSRVHDAFAATFDRLALGAAVTVIVDGRSVVDLWGGVADTKQTPWERDTVVNLFSVTKAFTAACAHHLVDRGLLDLDAPVARYWPEFAENDKSEITVRMLIAHRAGLPAVRAPLAQEALFDWSTMTGALAAESPWWTPGSAHGYHAVTYGWLLGEVIRRVADRTTGAYFREHLARHLDLQLGLRAEDAARCAILKTGPRPSEPTLFERIMADPTSMTAKAFANPITLILPGTVTSTAYRSVELPSVNGHGTARAIAQFYDALPRVLSAESLARARTEQSSGLDLVLDVDTRFGLGFMLSQPSVPGASFGSASSFGHPGAGGSLGFLDPEARVAFGFTVNRMGSSILIDPRATSLIDAVYASL